MGCALSATSECESNLVAGYLIGAGMGAAIRASLDTLIRKRVTVFSSPPGATGEHIRLSPTMGPHGLGLRVTMNF